MTLLAVELRPTGRDQWPDPHSPENCCNWTEKLRQRNRRVRNQTGAVRNAL